MPLLQAVREESPKWMFKVAVLSWTFIPALFSRLFRLSTTWKRWLYQLQYGLGDKTCSQIPRMQPFYCLKLRSLSITRRFLNGHTWISSGDWMHLCMCTMKLLTWCRSILNPQTRSLTWLVQQHLDSMGTKTPFCCIWSQGKGSFCTLHVTPLPFAS